MQIIVCAVGVIGVAVGIYLTIILMKGDQQ